MSREAPTLDELFGVGAERADAEAQTTDDLVMELLDALRAMEKWGSKMCRVPRPDSPLAKARAAIIKAEGQL